jgi:pyruvate/2-oxoglutarate dehydrogenase complex dihydrolipoamide dehydrogenase (E3) component
VFAAGDVAAVDGAAPAMFTHVAGYHAGVVLKRALFHLPAKVDMRAMPRATYCDPELAAVGLSEEEAVAQGLLVDILRWPLGENDRARAERSTQGMVKALIGPRGRILGAAILATHAGDLIQQWTMAIAKRLPIGAMAEVVAPYPTLGEASKRAAGSWYTPRLFTPRTRRIVRFVQRFG